MITINSDKGPFKVESWGDLLQRPGFTVNLDPKQHELKSVIGRYIFGEMVKCGLSNCHTPHARGYIVVTKNGLETNIGKDCGKKYFALEFDHLAKQFDADLAAYENRDLLWSFSFRVEDLEAKIAALRTEDKGADWVNKYSGALVNPGKLPVAVTRQIISLVKQKSGKFTRERLAFSYETEDMEARAGRKLERPLYVTEFEGDLRGIEALYPENNLRELLMVEILDELKAFKAVNIDTLTNSQLVKWKKWATSVDVIMDRAIESVDHGRRLLTKENLTQLLQINGFDLYEERERFIAFLEQLG
jgi:hypothetical protein